MVSIHSDAEVKELLLGLFLGLAIEGARALEPLLANSKSLPLGSARSEPTINTSPSALFSDAARSRSSKSMRAVSVIGEICAFDTRTELLAVFSKPTALKDDKLNAPKVPVDGLIELKSRLVTGTGRALVSLLAEDCNSLAASNDILKELNDELEEFASVGRVRSETSTLGGLSEELNEASIVSVLLVPDCTCTRWSGKGPDSLGSAKGAAATVARAFCKSFPFNGGLPEGFDDEPDMFDVARLYAAIS